MKANYKTLKFLTSIRYNNFYLMNWQPINTVGNVGYEGSSNSYLSMENCIGVWKIKQLKN